MSGVEASAVIGMISGIITIIKTTKTAYRTAKNQDGVPQAFIEVDQRLWIVEDTLNAVKRHLGVCDQRNLNKGTIQAVNECVRQCDIKCDKLRKIFVEVMPAESSSRAEKYLSAVRAMGKGNEVEVLM